MDRKKILVIVGVVIAVALIVTAIAFGVSTNKKSSDTSGTNGVVNDASNVSTVANDKDAGKDEKNKGVNM